MPSYARVYTCPVWRAPLFGVAERDVGNHPVSGFPVSVLRRLANLNRMQGRTDDHANPED